MSDRSYKFGVDFVYQHKDNKRFAPTPFSIFHSLRTREFFCTGFNQEFAPTLNARDYKDPKCVIVPSKVDILVSPKKPVDYRDRVATVLGGIGEKKSHNGTQYFQQDRIYDGRKTVAVCCSATLSNGSNMYLIQEDFKPKRFIVAMRGRNPKNPSIRKRISEEPMQNEIIVVGNYMKSNFDSSRIVHPKGIAPTVKENHGTVTATIVESGEEKYYQQRLEFNKQGICNTLTTVDKDNYVLEVC